MDECSASEIDIDDEFVKFNVIQKKINSLQRGRGSKAHVLLFATFK